MNDILASSMQPQPNVGMQGQPQPDMSMQGPQGMGQMPPELMQLVQVLSQFPPEALQMLMQLAMSGQQQPQQFGEMGGALDELIGVEMGQLDQHGRTFPGEQVEDVVGIIESGRESPLAGLLGPQGKMGRR